MPTFSQLLRIPLAGRRDAAPNEGSGVPVSDLDLRLSRLGRGERLVTWSRVALSAFSLAAVWLDPAEPARAALLTYSLLMAYVAWSVVLALVFARVAVPLPRVSLVAHIVDLTVAITINALTGAGSPFFVLFIFLLVAATLRWQWRGTLLTGMAALGAYLGLAFLGLERVGDVGFELNRFIIRGSYLAVVAVLLGFLGTWEARLRRDLVDLADFPRQKDLSFDQAARNWLVHAAAILRSPRVMLAWEETEEPWLVTLLWQDGEFAQERHDPGVMAPLVPERLRAAAFLCLDLSSETPTTLHTTEKGLEVWRGQPVHAEIVHRTGARNVLSVAVVGEGVNARLFAFDRVQPTSDDLVVGLILGRQIVGALEQQVLMRETRHSAANQERIRLARELHDGIAQSLTGAALHIGGLRRTLESSPETAQARLAEIEQLLVNEQRELRLFMQELRPSSATVEQAGLRDRLEELCHRVSRLWGVDVRMSVSGEFSASVAWEVYRLAQEALVNAARHSLASNIRVTVAGEADVVGLRVEDDGRGFPFQGVFDLAALNARRIGPLSLKERIANLRGDLVLHSSSQGTVLEISLPASAPAGAPRVDPLPASSGRAEATRG
jgi:signal transduction histidine kinase